MTRTLIANTTILDGSAPTVGRTATLKAATRRDLGRRLRAGPRDRLTLGHAEIGGRRIPCVFHQRRISLSGPDHDQIDRHFCELLPWPPGTSLLPTSAASVLPKAKRPPEGTIPPEGLKTELGLLCPTLFIPAVARFR